MQNSSSQGAIYNADDKKASKRRLAKQLIQHIMDLYDIIIQKIQHGVGLLWEQYFSQELFNIAKKRVQNQFINNSDQLSMWFQNISRNLRNKVNALSDSLISHFNDIIQDQINSLDHQINGSLQFTEKEELQPIQLQASQQGWHQNRQNYILSERCRETLKCQTKSQHAQKLCPFCSEDIGYLFRQQSQAGYYCAQPVQKSIIDSNTGKNNTNYQLLRGQVKSNSTEQTCSQQINQNEQLLIGGDQTTKRGLEQITSKNQKDGCLGLNIKSNTMVTQSQSSEDDDYIEGGMYGVFLGLLQIFQF